MRIGIEYGDGDENVNEHSATEVGVDVGDAVVYDKY